MQSLPHFPRTVATSDALPRLVRGQRALYLVTSDGSAYRWQSREPLAVVRTRVRRLFAELKEVA